MTQISDLEAKRLGETAREAGLTFLHNPFLRRENMPQGRGSQTWLKNLYAWHAGWSQGEEESSYAPGRLIF